MIRSLCGTPGNQGLSNIMAGSPEWPHPLVVERLLDQGAGIDLMDKGGWIAAGNIP